MASSPKDKPFRSAPSGRSVPAQDAARRAAAASGDAASAQPSRRLVAPAGARERSLHRRSDLADLRHRRRAQAHAGSAMPGVERLSVDLAVKAAEEAATLGIPAIALFPNTEPSLRDEMASEALNPANLVCRAVRAIKGAVPDIGIICDVALDPYTSHGHDGLLVDGEVDNDRTDRGADHSGPGPGRGRRRHPRPFGHDGRADRRDQGSARGERLHLDADPRLCREICLVVLWAVPRRGRLGREAQGRQARLSDGPGQRRQRRCARSRSTSKRAPTWSWSSPGSPISTSCGG